MRELRVAHVGNVANVAYNTAKFQRRLGIDADLYYYRADYAMAHPEWEDADFEGPIDLAAPDWRMVSITNGFHRPEWCRYLDGGPESAPVFDRRGPLPTPPARESRQLRAHLRALVASGEMRYRALARSPRLTRAERIEHFTLTLGSAALRWISEWRMRSSRFSNAQLRDIRSDVEAALHASRLAVSGLKLDLGDLSQLTEWRATVRSCRHYDIAQLYGLEATKGSLLPPEQPLVAVEHSTMRSIPFERSLRGRLLALAYRSADACVITNADVVRQATQLGLSNYQFIPHPLDEVKYQDAPTPLKGLLKRELTADLILICPTRHEWGGAFDSKRTDRALRAFIRYVHEAEPAGSPRAGLVLWEWGTDVARSKALLADAGLAVRVAWRRAMPKLRLLEYYRASDVVLDQFHEAVGAFGTATAEALSCSRPVVMHFDHSAHEWCLPEPPPVESALTEEQIFDRLVALTDAGRRKRVGDAGRAWIERWHGWERSTRLYLDLYREVLARRGTTLPT